MARTARKETGFLLLWLIFFPAFLRLLFHAINYGTAAAAELSSVCDAKEEEPCVPRKIVETFSEGAFDYIYMHSAYIDSLRFSDSLICISCLIH